MFDMGFEDKFEDEPLFGKSIRELVDMFKDFGKVLRYYFNRNEEPLQPQQTIESGNFPSLEEQRQASYLWFNRGYIPIELYNKCFLGYADTHAFV